LCRQRRCEVKILCNRLTLEQALEGLTPEAFSTTVLFEITWAEFTRLTRWYAPEEGQILINLTPEEQLFFLLLVLEAEEG